MGADNDENDGMNNKGGNDTIIDGDGNTAVPPSTAGSGGTGTGTNLPGVDVKNSVAFSLLNDLQMQGRLGKEEMEKFKNQYAILHEAVMIIHEREKSLLKRQRVLNNDVLRERITLQEVKMAEAEELSKLENLECEKDQCQKDFEEAELADTSLRCELGELQRKQEELTIDLENMQRENDELVKPELNRLEVSIQEMSKDHKRFVEDFDRDMALKQDLIAQRGKVMEETEALTRSLEDIKITHNKAHLEPERIRKQIDSVKKAKENLLVDLQKTKEHIHNYDLDMERSNRKKREAEEVKKSLLHKLELHKDTIENRQQDVESVKSNLDIEKAKHHSLVTQKFEIELKRKELDSIFRQESDLLSLSKKEYETLKRKMKRKRQIADATREVLPQLRAQLNDSQHLLVLHKNEFSSNKKRIDDLKEEVDIYIARFLKQEGSEDGKAQELSALVEEVEKLELELQQWVAEERKQHKLISILSAHREMKAREAIKARQAEKDTQEQVRMKELVILDFTKTCTEYNNRLKEFSALYDIVKNERNKYVNLIQSSSQALAEMNEKIKILQNEIEILKNESKVKDRELAKEMTAHQNSQAKRDGLRYDTNKSQIDYKVKQEIVDQQIVEIDKLNLIINNLERCMLTLKTKYERGVESRNLAGVQLIDRNDELCILYEKANLQEQTIKQGEIALRSKENEERMLKLQVDELARQIEAARKQMPQIPELADKISKLQDELGMEKTVTDQLCRDLEDPQNTDRWRPLGGEDPDAEQLQTKIHVLEERLNRKKEQLLEKELVLEEVTNLTEKLRTQASEGRDDSLRLSSEVSSLQGKIRETTRKMMALVSELSMYQATAMKLQQEKHRRETERELALQRLQNGEAPTMEAEKEWFRAERTRMAKEEQQFMSLQKGTAFQHPRQVLRTTAEPRPNAYVQEELGLPKPYGGLAPFKPTETGTTMRHIVAPNQAAIQI